MGAAVPVIGPSDAAKHGSLVRKIRGRIRIDRPSKKHPYWHLHLIKKHWRIPLWPGPKK